MDKRLKSCSTNAKLDCIHVFVRFYFFKERHGNCEISLYFSPFFSSASSWVLFLWL